MSIIVSFVFFFNDTATTEIYTLSLHDALPISRTACRRPRRGAACSARASRAPGWRGTGSRPSRRAPSACRDRKSTRLNSSHANISYAVFCLKKKQIAYRYEEHLSDLEKLTADL